MNHNLVENAATSIDKAILCDILFETRVSANNMQFDQVVSWLRQELGHVGYKWDYTSGYFYFKHSKDASFFALKWSKTT